MKINYMVKLKHLPIVQYKRRMMFRISTMIIFKCKENGLRNFRKKSRIELKIIEKKKQFWKAGAVAKSLRMSLIPEKLSPGSKLDCNGNMLHQRV